MDAVLYIHGRGGSAAEVERYRPLFPGCDAYGLDYRTSTPWETGREIRKATEDLKSRYENVLLIANSIGAFFSMYADVGALIRKACFISPVVDMETLICGIMTREGVTEADLRSKGEICTASGEVLSWEYLRYVRSRPVEWNAPTRILYGRKDALTSFETIRAFAERHGASLTVMDDGEHWFHTPEQLRFLDDWIRQA